MRIASYNVNGIRAALRKGFLDWLVSAAPDVICLQEIKATEEQLDLSLFEAAGYPHTYWFPAEKKGYSGVAILSRERPEQVVRGTGIPYMDQEGRNIRADFGGVSVMSLYIPSGTNIQRLDHKLMYMDDFQHYIDALKADLPDLVICGDYNICHRPIDIHDPVRNKNVSGFLPVEREWIGNFIESGFIDSFRHFNPDPHNYTWWTYRAGARERNKGWRLDYGMVSETLEASLSRSVILPGAVHSDHCPILLELN